MNAGYFVAVTHIPRFIRRIFTIFFVFLIQIFSFHLLNVTHWYLFNRFVNKSAFSFVFYPFNSLFLNNFGFSLSSALCYTQSIYHPDWWLAPGRYTLLIAYIPPLLCYRFPTAAAINLPNGKRVLGHFPTITSPVSGYGTFVFWLFYRSIAGLLTSIIVYTILNCYFIVCGPFYWGFITIFVWGHRCPRPPHPFIRDSAKRLYSVIFTRLFIEWFILQ